MLAALNIYDGNFHCGKSQESSCGRYTRLGLEQQTHFESYAHGSFSRAIQFLMQISDGDAATTSRFQPEQPGGISFFVFARMAPTLLPATTNHLSRYFLLLQSYCMLQKRQSYALQRTCSPRCIILFARIHEHFALSHLTRFMIAADKLNKRTSGE